MVAKQLIVAVFLLGVSWAQTDGADGRPELPRDMADQCIRNGGEEAYNNVERAIKRLKVCENNIADWKNLVKDIEDADRLHRSVKEVLKKSIPEICSKKSKFFVCITDLIESLKPCFKEERARGNLDVIRDVYDQLLEFICQENGAVITSFIAGGLECFKQPDTGKELEGCLIILQPLMPQRSNITVNNVLDYIDYDDSTCGILYDFQKCVVQKLKTCSQEVRDTAQSLIRNLRVSTPCKHKANSASGLTVTILSSVMAASSLLLM